MERAEIVFVPTPLMGHFTQALEMAKLMINQNNNLSFTFLLMKLPFDPTGTALIESVAAAATSDNIKIHYLPPPDDDNIWNSSDRSRVFKQLVENQKPHVKDVVRQRQQSATASSSSRAAGFMVDMLFTAMMDVAADLGLPCYVFFTSPAAFLGMMLHFQTLQDEYNQDISELKNSGKDLLTPCFDQLVPPGVLPTPLADKQHWNDRFLQHSRDHRNAKAIIINTFSDLESYTLSSFLSETAYGSQKIPPVYPIGPVLNMTQPGSHDGHSEIMKWLDDQPPSSVVFVCFGSIGALQRDQVKEIADALKQSGYRFLWSLRRPPPNDKLGLPTEYTNFEEVLPKEFLDQTVGKMGKVVGWSPQFAILSHPSVGGFVSHCGWNSILESIWCGVPIATWPLQAEQQLNAFVMVRVLGLAVEITLDYNERNENKLLVTAEQIEDGIRKVMDGESEVRKRVKDISDKSKRAVSQGGSSHHAVGKIIEEVMENLSPVL